MIRKCIILDPSDSLLGQIRKCVIADEERRKGKALLKDSLDKGEKVYWIFLVYKNEAVYGQSVFGIEFMV